MENKEILGIRTITLSKRAQIVIPKFLRKLNPKFKEGSHVLITIFDDRIEIKPLHGGKNVDSKSN